MSKKILTIFFITLGLVPMLALAADNGLVPCGGPGQADCSFSNLADLFKNVRNFLLKYVLFPGATLAIAFVGIQYMTALGNPGKLAKAHEIFWDVLWGIFLAIAAYAIIYTIFYVLTKAGTLPSITG